MEFQKYQATRYVTPLREGGSMPALVEAGDGLWVTKFVGAGQGARALLAELIVGSVAARLGLNMPDLSLIELNSSFGRTEADPEIQDLLRASEGLNVGMRYLDAALNFDPVAAADLVEPEMAADVVWLDAFAMNIDRTVRNPNMMVADEQLWVIDHGAALYFHHAWQNVSAESMQRPFAAIGSHVLLAQSGDVMAAHDRATAVVDAAAIADIVAALPDELLMHAPRGTEPAFETAEANREAYRDALTARVESRAFAEAAEAARTSL